MLIISFCTIFPDVSSHMQKESLSSTDIYDRISQEIHSVHNSSATISNVCAPVYEDQQTEGLWIYWTQKMSILLCF